MKNKFPQALAACIGSLFIAVVSIAQENTGWSSGSFETFRQQVLTAPSKEAVEIRVSPERTFSIRMNIREEKPNGDFKFYGDPLDHKQANFYMDRVSGSFEGALILRDEGLAWKFTLDESGNLISRAVNIHSLICYDYAKVTDEEAVNENPAEQTAFVPPPQLESLPGAQAVLYIDFDGEVVSGTRWVSGGTINAVPRNLTTQQMTDMWQVTANDYLPYTINVTTIRARYDNAPVNSRIMAIVTTTDDAAPGSGGVAYIGSFDDNLDDPCWVFNGPVQAGATTQSHEAGHTFGMGHDGTSATGYYGGNNLWGPIMGSPFNESVMHWSKGGYPDANNAENDLSIIDNNINVAYRQDLVGNTIGTAKPIVHTAGLVTAVDNTFIIEQTTDKDVFEIISGSGQLNLVINAENIRWPSLNVGARLLDANGTQIAAVNTEDGHKIENRITQTLAAGIYYLEVDGAGLQRLWTGSPHGYDDYSSLGRYTISGSFEPSNTNQPPIVRFEADQTFGCGSLAVKFTDNSVYTPSSWLWDFGDGNTSTQQSPTHTYSSPGQFTVKLTATNQYGSTSDTKTSLIDVQPGTIYPSFKGGEFDNAIGTGAYFSANDVRGLFFDAHEDIVIESIKVFSDLAGSRQIDIISGGTMNATDGSVDGGTVLTSATVSIPTGENVVNVNLEVPAGTNYFIKLAGTVNLYRNADGGTYPYVISDTQKPLATITQSNALGSELLYYYYFYDWKIRQKGCSTGTGIEEVRESNAALFPNPVSGMVNVRFMGAEKTGIQIYNIMGMLVYSEEWGSLSETVHQRSMDLSHLAAGSYMVKITSGSTVSNRLIIRN